MRFAILLTASLFLSGCKLTSAPQWPKEVTEHYYFVLGQDGTPFCFMSKILSSSPQYLLDEANEVPLEKCDGLSGYLPHDMKSVISYKDRTVEWSVKHCKKK